MQTGSLLITAERKQLATTSCSTCFYTHCSGWFNACLTFPTKYPCHTIANATPNPQSLTSTLHSHHACRVNLMLLCCPDLGSPVQYLPSLKLTPKGVVFSFLFSFLMLSRTSTEVEPCRHLLQELEHQSDPRHGSPSHTTAAMTTADTVTQGSSGPGSGSRMVMDVDVGRQQSRQVTPAAQTCFMSSVMFLHIFTQSRYVYVCLLACLSVCLSVCLSACPSVCLNACLSVCLPACLSVCLYACGDYKYL